MDTYDRLLAKGYYFDRKIDLDFLDSEERTIFMLRTPDKGIKPSIMVKGTYIEGNEMIDTFISIQNLSYNLDISAVAYIRCKMYYGGMENQSSAVSVIMSRLGLANTGGTTVLFSVLYADQEKEPPNRAVRFQCTTASKCAEMAEIPVSVDYSGMVALDVGQPLVAIGKGSKKGAMVSTTLITYLQQLAVARNLYVTKKYKRGVIKNDLMISSIECPKNKEKMKINVTPKRTTFRNFLLALCGMEPPDPSKPGFCKMRFDSYDGKIVVTNIVPSDWEERASSNGAVTSAAKQIFYNTYYSNDKNVTPVLTGGLSGIKPIGTEKNPIELNFVKAAYRTENLINITTMFDGRLAPSRFVVINSAAIMGKGSGTSAFGSRITKLLDKTTLFRITGKIDFEFSTTEQSTMSFTGEVHEVL